MFPPFTFTAQTDKAAHVHMNQDAGKGTKKAIAEATAISLSFPLKKLLCFLKSFN